MEGLEQIQNLQWETVKIHIDRRQARYIGELAARRDGGEHAPGTTFRLNTSENAPLFWEELGVAGECAFVSVLKDRWIKFDADFLADRAKPDFKVYDERDRWEHWDVKTQSSKSDFVVWSATQAEKWQKRRASQREDVLIFAVADGNFRSKEIHERLTAIRFLGVMPPAEFIERATLHTDGKMRSGRTVKHPCYELHVSDLYTVQSLLNRAVTGFRGSYVPRQG